MSPSAARVMGLQLTLHVHIGIGGIYRACIYMKSHEMSLLI